MKLGIIGCGNMGSALARGVLSKKVLPFNSIYISDKDPNRTKTLYKKFGIFVSTNEELVKKCDIIVIAVKPQDAKKLFESISQYLDEQKHLISIMAGITLRGLESSIDRKKIAITRAMPNMAALAGRSITAICHNKTVKHKDIVHKIFSSIGDVIEIEEKYMDVVTAIAGSGPAYFFYLVECLADSAIKMGLRKEKALKLAVTALIGSGALLEALELPPAALRERVTSKRGTTEAAIHTLQSKDFKGLISQAVKAAARRAKELSQEAQNYQ